MQINWELVWEIVKILLALLVGAWIKRAFEGRARLTTYLGHIAGHKIQEDNLFITWSVILRNGGKAPAHNVRVKHEVPPLNFEIIPSRPFALEDIGDGGQDIVFDKLVPNEQLTISYLRVLPANSTEPGVINRGISSDEGLPKVLNYIPMRSYPLWTQRMATALMFIGSITAVYLVWVLIEWLVILIRIVAEQG